MRTIRPAVGASARFETLEHESILRQRCYALCVWRLEMDFRGFWRPLRKRSVCHPSRLSRSVTARCLLCVRPLYGRSTTQPVTYKRLDDAYGSLGREIEPALVVSTCV